MRNFFLFCILLFSAVCSNAADPYTSVKSSLYETISTGFNVQLIDANISGHYILFQIQSESDISKEFADLELALFYSGYQLISHSNTPHHQLLIKLPKESIDKIIQQFMDKFENVEVNGLELIVLGAINQQRLLGAVNRQFNSSNLKMLTDSQASTADSAIELHPLDPKSPKTESSSWTLGLATALINCDYLKNRFVSFLYSQNWLTCNGFSPNQYLTDKEVANLKDSLYSNIQLSLESPEGFLAYISSFKSERRLELSQSFYNILPSLSIDNILEYHYRNILKIESDSLGASDEIDKVSSYDLPKSFKVKSTFNYQNTKVVSFNITIDNPHTCIQLNCQSLASLAYITYTQSVNTHSFTMQYPSAQETSIIDELNKVFFIPLSTSVRIAQEDILVSLQGGYLTEAYDDSFKLLSKLSLVNSKLSASASINTSDNADIFFYLNKDNHNQLSVNLNTIPGGEYWEESELYYFIVHHRLKSKNTRLNVFKANTLINFEIPKISYNQFDASPVYVDFSIIERADAEAYINSIFETLVKSPDVLTRNQFVEYKKGLLTNLALLDGNDKSSRKLSQMFDLNTPQSLLIQRLENMSYEQFISFLRNIPVYSTITISTRHEIDNDFQAQLETSFSKAR